MSTSRRTFLSLAPALLSPLVLPTWSPLGAPSSTSTPTAKPNTLDEAFPSHPPERAYEMVGAAHGRVREVEALLARWPTLANAAVDWGFGDWEDALGAASHVGNREIAAALIAAGARPTLFSAAMLGQLDIVKAFLTAEPGLLFTRGAHGISLLRHAEAGGAAARAVHDYLKTLAGADRQTKSEPLSEETRAALCGTYVFGAAPDDKLVIEASGERLSITRPGHAPRGLVHLGDRTFSAVGADQVRIRFAEQNGSLTLSVFDPDLLLVAERMAAKLWGAETYVDAEAGLNTVIAKVREALGDRAEAPIYIATVPKRGYRFVATIEDGPSEAKGPSRPRSNTKRKIALSGFALCLIVGVSVAWMRWSQSERVPIAVVLFHNETGDASLDATSLVGGPASLEALVPETALKRVKESVLARRMNEG